jgi:hypothetical protein
MTPSIEIIVSPVGQTTVQTKGFVGSVCRDASRLLELALGQPAGERLTAEFYLTSHEKLIRVERL